MELATEQKATLILIEVLTAVAAVSQDLPVDLVLTGVHPVHLQGDHPGQYLVVEVVAPVVHLQLLRGVQADQVPHLQDEAATSKLLLNKI